MQSIKLFPRNLVSHLVGRIVSLEPPSFLAYRINQLFAYLFKLNMEEAQKPLREYKNIQDLFTRKLKPGSRSFEKEICSPADGWMQYSQTIHNHQLIQAKKQNYSALDLIGKKDETHLDLSWFVSIYLAPSNYHRVHSPVTGELHSITHIRGDLWPVNKPYVSSLSKLFCRNERMVFEIKTEKYGTVFLIMVGALNVGKIKTPFLSNYATNEYLRNRKQQQKTFTFETPKNLQIGAELGTFMLGSTVILIFEKEFIQELSPKTKKPQKIQLGNSLI